MPDLVSKMEQERDAVSVHFLRFTTLAKDRSKTVCFFEGEDQKYFGIRLDLSKLKSSWVGIDCGGKKNVIELYSIITNHETYKKSLIAFFVDRDFDAPIPANMRGLVYETPCYSIENLYSTEHCISRILDAEFKFGNHPTQADLTQKACLNFLAILQQFHSAIRPLNVWIKAHRTKEKVEGLKKLNLQNQPLDSFVKITATAVTSILAPNDIPNKFPGCYSLTKEEIQAADALLPTVDQQLHFRGKYQIEFVRKYLENLRQSVGDSKSPFYNPKCSVKLTLTKTNLISELSQYAFTPDCLLNFLRNLPASQGVAAA